MPASIGNPEQWLPESVQQALGRLKPENARVDDPAYVNAIRAVASFLNMDTSQGRAESSMTAMMAPMQTGAAGGLLGRLADLLKPTATKGAYSLVDASKARVASRFEAGAKMPQQADWNGISDELLHAFGGDRALAEKWARMFGATSPNTSVPVNLRESVSALAHHIDDPASRLTLPQARTLEPAKITMAGSKVPNINRAYEGVPLGTPKVEELSQITMGSPGRHIPLDVHALDGMGVMSDKLDTEFSPLRQMMTQAEGLPARGGLTDRDLYYRAANALGDTLDEIAPGMASNPAFAMFWEGDRVLKGLPHQGGPIDILRRKGLLEKAAMLDPDRLRAALRSAGWTAGAIAAVMQAMDSVSPETMPLEPDL